MKLSALVVVITATMVLGGGGLASGARESAPRWKVERPTNPANTEVALLASVACRSRRMCIAVGSSSGTLSTPTRTLAERWNGMGWRSQPIVTPKRTSDSLFGVSCPSAGWCMVVGSAFHEVGRRQTALTEVWNGTRWQVQPTAKVKTRDASLQGVSCTSRRSCVAVGWRNLGRRAVGMIERWDGRSWHVQALSRRARSTHFSGVSCKRASCTAVGYGPAHPLALAWNGKTWRVQKMPLPRRALQGDFDSVSCSSPRACTATGTYINQQDGGLPLAERWNGHTWHPQRTAKPGDWMASLSNLRLDSVSCSSAKSCTAVALYTPNRTIYFLESWNGHRWRLQPAPFPANFVSGALLGIACVSTHCQAVGGYSNGIRIQATLALGH